MTEINGGGDRCVVLGGFLDWFRGVAEAKLDGLTAEQATEVKMPSGTTMLGIVKHLAWAERLWFRHYSEGEPFEVTIEESFVLAPADTVDSVLDQYRAECARSRQVVDGAPTLDRPSAFEHRVWGTVTVEWIMTHMLEETARHCGHLDILRELTDGRAGD
jgi:uncharacterized damage-inducible protein DinB